MRKRKVPHIDGRYSVLASLTIDKKSIIDDIKQLQTIYKKNAPLLSHQLELLSRSSTLTTLGFHLSVSRTWYLRYYQIEHFVNDFVKQMKHVLPFTLLLRSSPLVYFPVIPNSEDSLLRTYHQQKKQCFLSSLSSVPTCDNELEGYGAIEVDESVAKTTIIPLIQIINRIGELYGLQSYYIPPRPHLSLFYTRSGPFDPIILNEDTNNLCFKIKHLVLQIGKAQLIIPFGCPSKQWSFEEIIGLQSICPKQTNSESNSDDSDDVSVN